MGASLLLAFGRLRPVWEHLCSWYSALCGQRGSVFAAGVWSLEAGVEVCLLLAFGHLKLMWERLLSWYSVV